jgi:hypothetical protein
VLAPSSVSAMSEYRVFTVGPEGDFIGSRVLLTDRDEQAVEKAKQLLDGYDVHIWSGTRFVGRLKHTEEE